MALYLPRGDAGPEPQPSLKDQLSLAAVNQIQFKEGAGPGRVCRSAGQVGYVSPPWHQD